MQWKKGDAVGCWRIKSLEAAAAAPVAAAASWPANRGKEEEDEEVTD